MKQESMNLESQESLDYAARIAAIPAERLEAIKAAQAERSERFHAARRVLEKLRAWHPDCAVYSLERLEEAAQEAKERADAKAKKSA